ncbi:MAG: hypothetical protein JO279_08810 [Verrucomicrobia bacterium]|nr:hypothetical protein [Verrucomicrobiota bacterium]
MHRREWLSDKHCKLSIVILGRHKNLSQIVDVRCIWRVLVGSQSSMTQWIAAENNGSKQADVNLKLNAKCLKLSNSYATPPRLTGTGTE